MAFEDVYGEVLSTSVVAGYYDEVNDSYLRVLLRLLPPGIAWAFDAGGTAVGLLEGMSYSFFRLQERAKDLLEEFDPRATTELLEDWERLLGLPGTNPNPPTTIAGRRAAVHGLLLGHGDPTPDNFNQIAGGLSTSGIDPYIEHKTHNPLYGGTGVAGAANSGSGVGGALTQNEWAHTWYIVLIGADDPNDDETLMFVIRKTVPEHTRCVFKIAREAWTARESQFGATGVVWHMFYANEIFIALGSSASGTAEQVSTSPDGITWTDRNGQFGASTIWYGTYGNNVLVIVGDNGKISTSTDGVTWTARVSGVIGALQHVLFVPATELFLAVGASGSISTSADNGATWALRVPDLGYAGTFVRSAYGRSLYVIVGTSGELQTSPDGITWTSRTSQFGTSTILSIAYGNGSFAAVGSSGKASYSSNGISWVTATSQFGTDTINQVIWVADLELFIAVGANGKISTSPTGKTWTARISKLTGIINSVHYGNGLLVACGTNSELAISRDGISWFARTSNAPTATILRAGVLGGNYRFAIGGTKGAIQTTMYGEL